MVMHQIRHVVSAPAVLRNLNLRTLKWLARASGHLKSECDFYMASRWQQSPRNKHKKG